VLGRFLEFSVQVDDIAESLAFYRALGFSELPVGDVWTHRYAVVSDGELCIGLHDKDLKGPTLTFVHHDLARNARNMTDSGFEFDTLQLDEDAFNELTFHDPNNHSVAMIEARTFSPPGDTNGDSLLGELLETTLPARDALKAGLFWAPIAPEVLRIREEPTTHMRFNAGGMPLGLSESIALTAPSLSLRCNDRDAIWIALARHSFDHKEFPGFEGAFMSITAPEGTNLFLFDGDFLGETYVVDENGEDDDDEEKETDIELTGQHAILR